MSDTELPEGAIEVAVAEIWVNNWRNPTTPEQEAAKQSVLELKGMWVPGEDLINIMHETGAVNGRSYFAIDEDNLIHTLYVGVDAAGNDMVDEEAGQYVYDFTRPCPPTCSGTGPFR
ncbi:MAG: hypothetical protein AB8B56_07170 [Crocinitomicaceae bacterium]